MSSPAGSRHQEEIEGWVLQTAVSTVPGLPTLQSGQNPHTWGPQMLDFKPNAVLGFPKAPQAQVMGKGSRKGKFIWLLKIGSAKPHPQSEQHSTVHVIKGVGPPPMVGGTPEVLPVVQEVSNVQLGLITAGLGPNVGMHTSESCAKIG